MNLPWSQTFYLCCQDVSDILIFTIESHVMQVRNFVDKYYQFVEGVAQYQRDIDELLGKVWRQINLSHCPCIDWYTIRRLLTDY